jgi:sugar diacid utilization regulator
VWLAVAWRANTGIEEGRHEASVVLDLVTSLAQPPGVYGVEDVVVEYALMQDTSALVALLSLIAPVVHQQSLRTTLETLIATGGNRSKAANALDIHRSTLNYRLGRIEQLTGHTPNIAHGLQTLAAALTMYEVVHAPGPADRSPEQVRAWL